MTLSKSPFFIGLFEILKIFYPPKGLCKADTEGGQIVFTYVLFCLRKGILDLQFSLGNPLGTFKMFYPRRDSAKQIPKAFQLSLLVSYFVLLRVCNNFPAKNVSQGLNLFPALCWITAVLGKPWPTMRIGGGYSSLVATKHI